MNSNSESNSLNSRDFAELELEFELAKIFAELDLNSRDFGIANFWHISMKLMIFEVKHYAFNMK